MSGRHDRRTTGTKGLGASGVEDSLRDVRDRECHRASINKTRAAVGELQSADKGPKQALYLSKSGIAAEPETEALTDRSDA
jgi:hypothetical protein